MNVSAKFDEIPSKILKVIKETKRYGHTPWGWRPWLQMTGALYTYIPDVKQKYMYSDHTTIMTNLQKNSF